MHQVIGLLAALAQAVYALFSPGAVHHPVPVPQDVPAVSQVATSTAGAPVVPASTHAEMKQYVDTDFGFSFWYPAQWRLAPMDLKTAPVQYNGGTVTKRLQLIIAQTRAFTIESFDSPTATISPGYSGSTGAGCRITYSFVATLHQWLESATECDGPVTEPADISHNTMGGLHVFSGAAGLNPQFIVPLSAHHFVVVTYQGDVNFNSPSVDPSYLVNTIVAADPSVATPVTEGEKKAVIEAARQAYRGQ